LRSAQKNRKAAWESHERLMVVGSQARSMIRNTWGLTAAGSWHTVVATRGFCLLWSEYRQWRKCRRTFKESRRRSAPWRWRAPGDPLRRRLELLRDVRNSLSHLEFLNEAEIQGLIEEC
jgi:hypothetical protein